MSSGDYFDSNGSNVPKITLNSASTSRVPSALSSRLNSPSRLANQKNYLLSNVPAYKQIKVETVEANQPDNASLQNSVSFDTVALDFDESGDDDDDYDYDCGFPDLEEDDGVISQNHDPRMNNYLRPGRGGESPARNSCNRLRSPSPYRDLSPMRPASFSSLSDIEGTGKKKLPTFDHNGWRTDYPTEPNVKHNSLATSFKHRDFDGYVSKKDNLRTLLVYITGRRHSWVALDYVIGKLLKDGDHIVILTRIPISYKHKFASKIISKDESNTTSTTSFSHHLSNGKKNSRPNTSKSIKTDTSLFKTISDNIQKYVEFLIGDSKIVSFTIDIALYDSTSRLLKESVSIYDPCAIITSTKPNLKFQRKHTWNTSRITDRLVKNFEIPITVVPAFTLNQFELEFFEELVTKKRLTSNLSKIKEKLKAFDHTSSSLPSLASTRDTNTNTSSVLNSRNESITGLTNQETNDINTTGGEDEDFKSDDSSILSTESESSTSSSIKDLTRTISNYKDILDKFIEDTEREPVTENTFLSKLNKVTDTSHKMSVKFLETSNAGGDGAALVRSLTGLPELSKQKSMLDVLEPTKTDEKALGNIKKSLHFNGTSSSSKNSKIPFSGHTSNLGTPKTIKFSNDISTPDKLKTRSQNRTNDDVNGLRKFKSHVEQSRNMGNNYNYDDDGDDYLDNGRGLSPSRSQPQQTLMKSLSESRVKTLLNDDSSMRSDDDSSKKSSTVRGRFRKLFGKSKKK